MKGIENAMMFAKRERTFHFFEPSPQQPGNERWDDQVIADWSNMCGNGQQYNQPGMLTRGYFLFLRFPYESIKPLPRQI